MKKYFLADKTNNTIFSEIDKFTNKHFFF